MDDKGLFFHTTENKNLKRSRMLGGKKEKI